MKIRYATKNDDFNVLAKLLYETDRYIYPYWFNGNKEEGIRVLSELLKREDTSFYYGNCIVAEEDKKIVGLLLYFSDKSPLSYDYSKLICKNFNYSHTLNNYFLALEKSVCENETYVAGLRVDDAYTRRHIAEKLMSFFFEKLEKNRVAKLDVLVENVPALCLYKKVGFEIIDTYKGYNGYRKKRPLCYSMKKKIK